MSEALVPVTTEPAVIEGVAALELPLVIVYAGPRAAFRGEEERLEAAPDRTPEGPADRDPGGRSRRGA